MTEWQSFIQQLKSKSEITEIIASYIPVVQKGRSYWAACPFHHERTPSFSISKTGQFYKCFGCGVSGDVIKFVQEYESVSFNQAVAILAARAGMSVPSSSDQAADKRAKEIGMQREKLLAALKCAALFYHRALLSPIGLPCREYLAKRGIPHSAIKAFALGYSPDPLALTNHLQKQGIAFEVCVEAGILEKTSQGRYRDALSGRLIVPIINPMREVIGFGGRTLIAKPDFAKYKNTRQTAVFDKSQTVYNINRIKKLKQEGRLDGITLVEGYMDVIGLAAHGFDGAAASMGTSLTVGQARVLKRYSSDICICFDGDSAGQGAALRGLDLLQGEELSVRVAVLPDGMDPDEFIKVHGLEAFKRLLASALPLCDYKLFALKRRYDINAANPVERESNRVEYTKQAFEVIRATSDVVEKEKLIRDLAADTAFSEGFIRDNVQTPPQELKLPTPQTDMLTKAKAFVAAALIANASYCEDYYPTEPPGSSAQKIFGYIKACRDRGEVPQLARLYEITGEADDLTLAIADCVIEEKPYEKRYYIDCLKKLKLSELQDEIAALNKQAQADPDNHFYYSSLAKQLIDRKNEILGKDKQTEKK